MPGCISTRMGYKIILVCTLTFFVAATQCTTATDKTLTEQASGKDVTEAVVRRIRKSSHFPYDQGFLRRWAYAETRDGQNPETYAENYFGGIWQISEQQLNLTKNLNSTIGIYEGIKDEWGIDWNSVIWEDLLKPFYSGLAGRLLMQYYVDQGTKIPGSIRSQADYYKDLTNNGTSSDFFSAVQELEMELECQPKMDVSIVWDVTTETMADVYDFSCTKEFVSKLALSFSSDSTRISLLTFEAQPSIAFNLSQAYASEELQTAIDDVTFHFLPTKPLRDTASALLKSLESFGTVEKREDAPQVMIVITRGPHNTGPGEQLSQAIALVKEAGIIPIVVGYESQAVDYSEMLEIALGDQTHVFKTTYSDALLDTLYPLRTALCEIPGTPTLVDSLDGIVTSNETRRLFLNLPNSLDNSLLIETMNITGWYSFTEQTPNSAVYDGEIVNGTTLIDRNLARTSLGVFISLETSETEGTYLVKETNSSPETEAPPSSTTAGSSEPTPNQPTTTTGTSTTEGSTVTTTTEESVEISTSAVPPVETSTSSIPVENDSGSSHRKINYLWMFDVVLAVFAITAILFLVQFYCSSKRQRATRPPFVVVNDPHFTDSPHFVDIHSPNRHDFQVMETKPPKESVV